MNRIRPALWGALVAYTAALFVGELATSQEQIRVFFTDVRPSATEMWFGLNTTLSVALLWSTAVLFAVATWCAREAGVAGRASAFYVSQVLFFLYAGADDRFKVHETVGAALGVPDHWLLLGLGVVELALLVTLAPVDRVPPRARRLLVGAAGCFAISTFIDGALASELRGRLSAEDLTKTWAGALLMATAWDIATAEIRSLADRTGSPG